MVGEVFLLSTRQVANYYGSPEAPELQMAFNFPPLFAPWEAGAWHQRVDEVLADLGLIDAWPTWVLSNHDNPRHATRYGDRDDRARAAAVLLLGLRGTAFLYAGEELGLRDADVPAGRRVDPGGRDWCRAPIPWTAGPGHGWGAGAEPWLPWPPDPDRRNVASQRNDPGSILWLYRRLLAARRSSAALRTGSFAWLDAGRDPAADGVLAWERSTEGDRRIVAVSFVDEAVDLTVDGDWTIEVASDGTDDGRPYPGCIGPSQALVLRPA
jgi:alpha-glucosidase